ncbi:MAG: hypothetical protein C4338_06190 [Rhodanobacteraceae bacterium]
MRYLLRPRARLFRGVLGLALLAWTSLAFQAFAHPLAMPENVKIHAVVATSKAMPSHCHSMAGTAMLHDSNSHLAHAHPTGTGHGCCANGDCHCASLCSGIVGVPSPAMVQQRVRDPELHPGTSQLAPTISAPPLRPPIA